jgi:alkanesulfonate monooxygenase
MRIADDLCESEGQRRMREPHGGPTASLKVAPNLWAGVALAAAVAAS